MNTFVTHPEEGGPFPVVFFYMDAPGKREELHDMARRLGSAGYYVVLPNLYYRSVEEFDFTAGVQEETYKRMFELMATLSDDLIESDTAAMFDHRRRRPERRRQPRRLRRLLHERPVLVRHGLPLPRPDPGRGVDLRRAPVRRRVVGRHRRPGAGRAVLRLRGARPVRARRR